MGEDMLNDGWVSQVTPTSTAFTNLRTPSSMSSSATTFTSTVATSWVAFEVAQSKTTTIITATIYTNEQFLHSQQRLQPQVGYVNIPKLDSALNHKPFQGAEVDISRSSYESTNDTQISCPLPI